MESSKRQILEDIGLTKNEIEVYLALMMLGSASAGVITRESCLHRRNVYDTLEKLVQRGLVSFVTKGKIKHFETTDPQRLLDILKEKRRNLEIGEKRLQAIMPDLLNSKNLKETQEVRIFMGREGRKLLFEDILRTAKENLVLGGVPPSKSSESYMTRYNRRRAKLGIRNKMIYNKRHGYLNFLKTFDSTEIRIMPRELKSRVTFNIYNNKVAILFRIAEKPFTILIENESVTNDFREYFNFIWDISRKA